MGNLTNARVIPCTMSGADSEKFRTKSSISHEITETQKTLVHTQSDQHFYALVRQRIYSYDDRDMLTDSYLQRSIENRPWPTKITLS